MSLFVQDGSHRFTTPGERAIEQLTADLLRAQQRIDDLVEVGGFGAGEVDAGAQGTQRARDGEGIHFVAFPGCLRSMWYDIRAARRGCRCISTVGDGGVGMDLLCAWVAAMHDPPHTRVRALLRTCPMTGAA